MTELLEKFYWYCAVGIVWLCLQLIWTPQHERKKVFDEFSRIARIWSVFVVALMVLCWWIFMLEFYWGKMREKIRGNPKIPPF